jgi:putative peptidoglycan lipid II flippase
VVNIILAAALAGPFKGGGIALALSAASAVNTILLLIFLKKNPRIEVGRALKSTLGYTFKLAILSAAAAAPVVFLTPRLVSLFANHSRLIAQGLPLAINAVLYGAIGIGLLLLTGDKQVKGIVALVKRRRS